MPRGALLVAALLPVVVAPSDDAGSTRPLAVIVAGVAGLAVIVARAGRRPWSDRRR